MKRDPSPDILLKSLAGWIYLFLEELPKFIVKTKSESLMKYYDTQPPILGVKEKEFKNTINNYIFNKNKQLTVLGCQFIL